MRRRLARWRELAALHALDRAKRMVRNGHDLKAERQHVPIQPGLDNLVLIRVVVPAPRRLFLLVDPGTQRPEIGL
jgi:hypothetical protein